MQRLNPIDLLGLDPQAVTDVLNQWGVDVDMPTVKYYMYGLILVGIVLLFILRHLLSFNLKRKKLRDWRQKKIEEKLRREFSAFIDKKENLWVRLWHFVVGNSSKEIFIETKFQANPPHDKEDPYENVSTEPQQNLIEFYIKKVLVKDSMPKFLYCVLGGSGMGKTTFAANLVKRYILAHTESDLPYDIFLYSLSNEAVMQDIKNVQKPESSILILDALDENNEAVKSYSDFIDKLEDAIRNFRIVIITCRTQFFANEEAEPRKSKLTYYSKGKTFQEYTRHYISVFDNDDIKNYIGQKFRSKKKRKSAERIVEKCSSVLVRPLMLSYIEDLVDYNPSDSLFASDIYKALINKWIEREVNFWETQKNCVMPELNLQLHDFSEKLAVDIIHNREIRGGLFLSSTDFEDFLRKNQFTGPYSYSGRSLVNRDSAGNYKFAHKSFLEYFLALHMFRSGEDFPLNGMDMLQKFYQEMCIKEFSELAAHSKVDNGFYQKTYPVLIINSTEGYALEHMNMVMKWKIIMISWGAVTEKLWSWLKSCEQLDTLVIFNYNGAYSLNPILNLHLESLYISGESTPGKTFVKKMKPQTHAITWDLVTKHQKITCKDIDWVMHRIEMKYITDNRTAILEKITGNNRIINNVKR